MGLRYFQVLYGLFAFIQVFLCTTYAYPALEINSTTAILQLTGDKDDTNRHADVTNLSLADRVKRMNNQVQPLVMTMAQGLEWTWEGFVAEPTNSGWTRATIRSYAQQGWQQTQGTPHATLVAALWVPGRGVYLGSIPHAAPGAFAEDEHVDLAFESIASNMAPLMWSQMEDRSAKSMPKGRYHAEHMALTNYETREKPRHQYPAGCYIAIYGQYHSRDQPGLKQPCSGGTAGTACLIVLRALTIAS